MQEELRNIPHSDHVVRDQYLDFIAGDSFRNTLLCHKDVELRRSIDPQSIRLSSPTAHSDRLRSIRRACGRVRWSSSPSPGRRSRPTTLDQSGSRESRRELAAGRRVPRDPAKGAEPSRRDGDKIKNNIDEETAAAANAFFRMYSAGHIELHLYPPRLTTNISERRAGASGAQQAETGSLLTSLRHGGVLIEDQITRSF